MTDTLPGDKGNNKYLDLSDIEITEEDRASFQRAIEVGKFGIDKSGVPWALITHSNGQISEDVIEPIDLLTGKLAGVTGPRAISNVDLAMLRELATDSPSD
jgi:hypothetical protein